MNRTIRDITRQAMMPEEIIDQQMQGGDPRGVIPEPTQGMGQPGGPMPDQMGEMPMDPMGAVPQEQESPWRDRSIEVPEMVVQPIRRR